MNGRVKNDKNGRSARSAEVARATKAAKPGRAGKAARTPGRAGKGDGKDGKGRGKTPKDSVSRGRKGNRRLVPKSEPAAGREPKQPRAPRVPLRQRLISLRERLRATWGRVRRPLWVVGRVALVLIVAAGAIAVGRLVEKHVRTSPAFATKQITVEGQDRLSREEVLEASGLTLDQNVFEVAPEDARARLLAHPWVADATVHRRLPETFEISIREHHAVAVIALGREEGDGDALYLVGEDGTVFKRVTSGDPLDLPVVTGIDRARFTRDRAWRTSVLVEAVALLHDYRGAGLWRREPIGEVHIEPDDGLSLYIGDDATHIRLGRGPFRRKLRRLRRVLDRLREREAQPAYVYLDNVRRPDRVTVRLR